MNVTPSLGELSVTLLEILLADKNRWIVSGRPTTRLQEDPNWNLLEDCWALSAGMVAPSGKTEEEVRKKVEGEIRYYSTLKGDGHP